MFPVQKTEQDEEVLRPMNCPHPASFSFFDHGQCCYLSRANDAISKSLHSGSIAQWFDCMMNRFYSLFIISFEGAFFFCWYNEEWRLYLQKCLLPFRR